ncbi:MAG: hypothetical protein WA252_00005 [Candidatus Sulfotelmatobacter sp.]
MSTEHSLSFGAVSGARLFVLRRAQLFSAKPLLLLRGLPPSWLAFRTLGNVGRILLSASFALASIWQPSYVSGARLVAAVEHCDAVGDLAQS